KRVGERHLAIESMRAQPLPIRRRQVVERARIVEVQPDKKECRTTRAEPPNRRVGHLVGAALRALLTRTGLVKLLVEIVEALVESKRRRDRVRADERRRAITLALEESRQRRVLRPEREDHVAADAVHGRVLSRED